MKYLYSTKLGSKIIQNSEAIFSQTNEKNYCISGNKESFFEESLRKKKKQIRPFYNPFWYYTLITFLFSISVYANDPAFVQRQTDYRNAGLTASTSSAFPVFAFLNQPLNSATLQNTINILPTKSTVDFDLVVLMRTLLLSNGAYDDSLLPAMLSLPYWVNKNDTLHGYWSENHMIMWMSTDWLLHEHYGKQIDTNLQNRLLHYLQLKLDYGFYEFFSPVYAPYCLSGLINLADFSQNPQIKNLASQASRKLLKEMLLLTNDQGVWFPPAGRSYPGKYNSAWGQNHSHLIWLLTGRGQIPSGVSHAGAFLATTNLELDSVIQSYTSILNKPMRISHAIDSVHIIHQNQYYVDRIMFTWSAGGYFHPLFAQQTAQLLVDSNMWEHVDFEPFEQMSGIAPGAFPGLAELLGVASKSTGLFDINLHLFKHHNITLSSMLNYNKGKLGYQQHPCLANVGTTAVYLGSGKIFTDWEDRNPNNANEHLPYVAQQSNVALLMYRPEVKPGVLPYYNNEIALHFKENDFDEIRENGNWLLGREGNSYVAIRRHCDSLINGVRACAYNSDGQSWVIIVGDSILYNTFDQFEYQVAESFFMDSHYVNSNNKHVYFASFSFDTVNLEYAWEADSGMYVGLKENSIEKNVFIYPNPFEGELIIETEPFLSDAKISIFDVSGRLVSEKYITEKYSKINTANFKNGIYMYEIKSGSYLKNGVIIK